VLRAATILALSASLAFAQRGADELDQAFARLYNFDFDGAHAILSKRIAAAPADPLPYAVRASAYLFSELDRLSILETEFFSNDSRIADKKKVKPDPAVRASLFKALDDAQSRADALLARNPNDQNALFALCVTTGVLTDYTALVEKRQISSLSIIKKGAAYANRLLKLNPSYYDAYLTTGMTEYVLGSLPFFVRWFIRVENIEGSKEKGIETVAKVARHGRYLKPFAKILLAVANLRDKRPRAAEEILFELARDYPENPLFKKELAQLTVRLESGR
jgi:predicted Zn-dependent protease